MIVPVTESMFIDYFRGSDQWRNHFSYAALQKLFELINDDEENDNVEFCHHSITEEWEEHDCVQDFIKDYDDINEDDVVRYSVDVWSWDKDGNKTITQTVLINKYQSNIYNK